MLVIKLTITTIAGESTVLDGELGNISMDAMSTYEADLDGRPICTLDNYPRWSESSRGLLARCIAMTEPAADPVPENWRSIRIDIGLNGGGRQRRPTRLAMTRMERLDEDDSVGWKEGSMQGFLEVPPRPSYGDVWDLALHALNISVWAQDEIQPTRPIVVPVYADGSYIRTSDLPEPVRSAFEWRQRFSGRPCVGQHDACWIWDWTDFLAGRR